MLSSDSSMMSIAARLPFTALIVDRQKVANFRDFDEQDHAEQSRVIAYLAKLFNKLKLETKVKAPYKKTIRVHGVSNEIKRALDRTYSMIQELRLAIAELYDSDPDSEPNPDLGRAQQAMFDMNNQLVKVSSLGRKFAEVSNRMKRLALRIATNLSGFVVSRRQATKRQRPILEPALATVSHKQIAKA